MTRKHLVFLHGFASSGQGAKAQFLRQKCYALPDIEFHAIDFNPTPHDFEYMTVTGMINRLRQYILDRQLENIRLIGSSMGALVAINYAHRYPDVESLLLLAPALAYRSGVDRTEAKAWQETGVGLVFHFAFEKEVPLRYAFEIDGLNYGDPVPPPVKMMIVHGRSDDILPIQNSRDYAAAHSNLVNLIEVDSDHRLNDQLDFIWTQVDRFSLDNFPDLPPSL